MRALFQLPFAAEYVNVVAQNPGLGNAYSWSPQKHTHALINSLRFIVTADATAITRIVRVRWRIGSARDIIFTGINNEAETANESSEYSASLGHLQQIVTSTAPKPFGFPFLVLSEDDDFIIDVQNLQAGDEITEVSFQYMSWPRDSIFYPEGLVAGGGPTIGRPPPGGGGDADAA